MKGLDAISNVLTLESQSHRVGVEPNHVRHHTHQCIAHTWNHTMWTPSLTSTQSIFCIAVANKKIAPCDWALTHCNHCVWMDVLYQLMWCYRMNCTCIYRCLSFVILMSNDCESNPQVSGLLPLDNFLSIWLDLNDVIAMTSLRVSLQILSPLLGLRILTPNFRHNLF